MFSNGSLIPLHTIKLNMQNSLLSLKRFSHAIPEDILPENVPMLYIGVRDGKKKTGKKRRHSHFLIRNIPGHTLGVYFFFRILA